MDILRPWFSILDIQTTVMYGGIQETQLCTKPQQYVLYQQVSKNKQEIAFYSLPEFEEWKSSTPNHKKWKVKYYKGL